MVKIRARGNAIEYADYASSRHDESDGPDTRSDHMNLNKL